MMKSTLSPAILGILLLAFDIMNDTTTTTYAFAPFVSRPGRKLSSPSSSRLTKRTTALNMAWAMPELTISDGTSRFDSKWYTTVENPTPRTMVFSDVTSYPSSSHNHNDDEKIMESYFWMKPCCDDWPSMELTAENDVSSLLTPTPPKQNQLRFFVRHPWKFMRRMIRVIPRKIYLVVTEPFHFLMLFLMSKIMSRGNNHPRKDGFPSSSLLLEETASNVWLC